MSTGGVASPAWARGTRKAPDTAPRPRRLPPYGARTRRAASPPPSCRSPSGPTGTLRRRAPRGAARRLGRSTAPPTANMAIPSSARLSQPPTGKPAVKIAAITRRPHFPRQIAQRTPVRPSSPGHGRAGCYGAATAPQARRRTDAKPSNATASMASRPGAGTAACPPPRPRNSIVTKPWPRSVSRLSEVLFGCSRRRSRSRRSRRRR